MPWEMVLMAIGIEPSIDSIGASGIACGRGVKVDNGMGTNILNIYAAGDVVETTDEFTGRTRVLGQWFPAIQQAPTAAYNMLGLPTPGRRLDAGVKVELGTGGRKNSNSTFLYWLAFLCVTPTAGF